MSPASVDLEAWCYVSEENDKRWMLAPENNAQDMVADQERL